MPHFRNVNRRQSGRLVKQEPIIYDEHGWEVPDPFAPSPAAIRQATSRAPSGSSHLSHSSHSSHSSLLGAIGPVSVPSSDHASSTSRRGDHDQGYHLYISSDERSASSSTPSADYSPPPDVSSQHYPLRRKKTSHARRKAADHIPRPRNAFILFRSKFLEDFLKKDGDKRSVKSEVSDGGSGDGKVHQNHISREAGKVWKSLNEEEKRPFHMLADIEKSEHQAKFPNYIYSPNGKVGRKTKSTRPTPLRRGSRTTVSSSTRTATLRIPVRPVRGTQAHLSSPQNYSLSPTSASPSRFAPCTPESDIPLLASPSPTPSPAPQSYFEESDEFMDTAHDMAGTACYVTTTDIPPLDLSLVVEKQLPPQEKTPQFDLSPQHPYYERFDEQSGFKPYTPHATVSNFLLSVAESHDDSPLKEHDMVLYAPVPRRGIPQALSFQLLEAVSRSEDVCGEDGWDGCDNLVPEPQGSLHLNTSFDEFGDLFNFEKYYDYNL